MGKTSTYAELLDAVRGGAVVRSHSGHVRPGDVFVAVPGASGNGARYIADALHRGACWIVTTELDRLADESAANFVEHPNPGMALGELAGTYYGTAEMGFPLVGVTGTNGKTTVSYLLEALLNGSGRAAGVLGTVSYRWPGFSQDAPLTTPGCLHLHDLLHRMAEDKVEAAVMEVSSHALDQDRVAGLTFDVAVLTNLTQDHLDYHKDMQSYFAAKRKLFNGVPRPDKKCVINADDEWGRKLLGEVGGLAYGFSGGAPAGADSLLRGRVLEHSVSGLSLAMEYEGERWELESQLVGLFNGANLLAAQGAGLALGLTPSDMRHLASFSGVPGRVERVPNRQGLNIFVDYAHTPDALDNVLSALKRLEFGRLITVFGCGGNRDRTKRPLMAQAVARHSDVAILTSDNPRHEDPIAIMNDTRPGLADCPMVLETPDRRKAIGMALEEMRSDDVLVVAGKGHETYQQIGDQKFDFSDRVVVMELLA